MKLINSNNRKLRMRSYAISDCSYDKIYKLTQKMIKFCDDINNNPNNKYSAAGLSAVQIGVTKRLFIAKLQGNNWEIFINPEITFYGPKQELSEEGCLSFPGKFGKIFRSTKIKVTYHNDKELIKRKLYDKDAIVFQHEYDHCNGIVCVDKFEKE